MALPSNIIISIKEKKKKNEKKILIEYDFYL